MHARMHACTHARAKGGGGAVFEAAYYGTKVAVKEVFKQVTAE